MLKQTDYGNSCTNEIYHKTCFAKAAITGAFHRASHHSINKKVRKIEIVHCAQIPQNTVKV